MGQTQSVQRLSMSDKFELGNYCFEELRCGNSASCRTASLVVVRNNVRSAGQHNGSNLEPSKTNPAARLDINAKIARKFWPLRFRVLDTLVESLIQLSLYSYRNSTSMCSTFNKSS